MDKPGDAKYGMTEQQLIDSYKELMKKGAKDFGIHAFLASNTISDAYYPELAGILFELAVRVKEGDRCPYCVYQPVRRRGHPVPPGADGERYPGHWRGCAPEI